MALTKNWTIEVASNVSVNIPNVYCKIVNISGDKFNIMATIHVLKDKTEFNPISIYIGSFQPNLESKNFIAQSYEHFKTLPEFENAQDC